MHPQYNSKANIHNYTLLSLEEHTKLEVVIRAHFCDSGTVSGKQFD